MYAQLDEPPASEVLEALVELTALGRRVNQVDDISIEGTAHDLLAYLLHLCRAERGAILLPEERSHIAQSGSPPAAQASESRFRALALHEMRAEDVAALLSSFTAATAPAHPLAETFWRAYCLSHGEEQVHAARGLLPLPDVSDGLTERAGTAWLVIGWVDQTDQQQARAALLARCSALLPHLTNAVEALIGTLLLKERMEELERKSVREALEGMELLKAELLGTVSHELRSPLASIKGYAATLLRHEHRLGHEERHQFLLAITEASDRMEAIIEHLLEVSQLETGQIALQRSPVNVVHLAGEAIAAMQEQVAASRPGHFIFHLQPEGADGAVPLIQADQRRLREVLNNLLENAVIYSPEGGLITVTVRERVQAFPHVKGEDAVHVSGERDQEVVLNQRRMLEVCVCDQGQGIPSAHIERVFERFHRVDNSLTRETGGLGLGLTICKRIVELHGGMIWAEHGPQGCGSALYVRLPIEAGEQL